MNDLVHATPVQDGAPNGQLTAVPTPLEIMAKANWARPGSVPWEMIGLDLQEKKISDMRAALLALAASELPPSVIKVGARRLRDGGSRDTANARDVFSVMLRALASPNEGKAE